MEGALRHWGNPHSGVGGYTRGRLNYASMITDLKCPPLDSPYGELKFAPPKAYFIDLRQIRANLLQIWTKIITIYKMNVQNIQGCHFLRKKAPAGRSTTSPRAWFHYLPLTIPLFVAICRYLPLFAAICRYLPLFAAICCYLPLTISLFAAICR